MGCVLGAALGSSAGAGGAVTVSGAEAVTVGVLDAATTVWSPASVVAGTVTVAVKSPLASVVAVPTSTGSECSVIVTVDSGAKPVPFTVTVLPASTLEGSTVTAGVESFSALTVTDLTVVSLPKPLRAYAGLSYSRVTRAVWFAPITKGPTPFLSSATVRPLMTWPSTVTLYFA